MRRLVEKFLKFGIVGVVATGIDFGVMILLREVFGVPTLVASFTSYCVSLIFNYLASMRFVFRHRQDISRRREFVVFVVLSVIGLGVNQLVMWAGTAAFGDRCYVVVKVFATGVVMLWNFFSRHQWLDADRGEES